MATLSKHGELGQIERLTYKLAYCSDGQVLRNNGEGWKIWKKCKPGIDPVQHFAQAQANYANKLATQPAFAEWRRVLHSNVAFRNRFLVLEAIKMLGNDVDGLWSELNDMANISLSLEDCQELVAAYDAACREADDIAKAKAAPQLESVPA